MQAAARSRAINLMKSLLQVLEPSCQAVQGVSTQQAPAVHTLVPVVVEGPDGQRTQAFQLRSTHLPANGAVPASHPGVQLGLAPGQPAANSAIDCRVATSMCRRTRLGMARTTLSPLWWSVCVIHAGGAATMFCRRLLANGIASGNYLALWLWSEPMLVLEMSGMSSS